MSQPLFQDYRQITARPRWIDIAETWRSRLGRAPWLPGARLPPNTEIGREFGVSKSRAQQALALLTSEGLLTRVPGRGTFVATAVARPAHVAPPRRVGILLDDDARRLPYYPHMASLLCDALGARGIDAWMRPVDVADPRVGSVLARSVRETGVSALFLCPVNPIRYDAIRALRPPVPLLCNSPLRYVAYAPVIVIYERIAAALKRIGARRPAFATHIRPEVAEAAYGPEGTIDIPRKDADGAWGAMFRLAMGKSGIRIDQSRIRYAYPRVPASGASFAAVGASARADVTQLLSATPRPDALVVFTDDLVPGAVAAVLESGLRVPQDLRCVFHCNTGMEPFVPFPCEWVANDVAADAALWAARLDDLLSGRSLEKHLEDHLVLPES